VDGLLGAARAAAWIIEHDTNEQRRGRLATEAVQACQSCVQRAPADISCKYRLALALGQQAREHLTTAAAGDPDAPDVAESAARALKALPG
jgi:hypothetical protein